MTDSRTKTKCVPYAGCLFARRVRCEHSSPYCLLLAKSETEDNSVLLQKWKVPEEKLRYSSFPCGGTTTCSSARLARTVCTALGRSCSGKVESAMTNSHFLANVGRWASSTYIRRMSRTKVSFTLHVCESSAKWGLQTQRPAVTVSSHDG